MAYPVAKIRLYVTQTLGAGEEIVLDRDQSHYLFGVMRQTEGGHVSIFNGSDGEWLAEIVQVSKRSGTLVCLEQTRSQQIVPDLWLCFAPIKKTRTDFIAEKACELGCSRIIPVFTHHTNAERVRADRLQAHAVEAAEQCGLTSVPDVAEPLKLGLMLDHWPSDRQIMFCDETRTGPDARSVLERADPGPWAVLTGPEGGFSGDEVLRLRRMPQAHSVSLGPRILRADTAAVAALALWQTALGDWR